MRLGVHKIQLIKAGEKVGIRIDKKETFHKC